MFSVLFRMLCVLNAPPHHKKYIYSFYIFSNAFYRSPLNLDPPPEPANIQQLTDDPETRKKNINKVGFKGGSFIPWMDS